MCPSTGPLLHGLLTADSTALRSCFKVRTNRSSAGKAWVPTTSLLSQKHCPLQNHINEAIWIKNEDFGTLCGVAERSLFLEQRQSLLQPAPFVQDPAWPP
jgi:hypothetical protein